MTASEMKQLEEDLRFMEQAGHSKIPIAITSVRSMIAALRASEKQ